MVIHEINIITQQLSILSTADHQMNRDVFSKLITFGFSKEGFTEFIF